ncbi:MAG: hydroxymethylglutaryl-CoA lyase [Phycisphaerales bacterium]|nr:hydroxymethylglutaryl-CoA lyase [Phycisphaerales bacterium]
MVTGDEAARRVRITEVGPRDGLQNEPGIIPIEQKRALVDALAATGLQEIEVGSFVRPDVIPQLADSAELFESLPRHAGVVYSALVPNLRGLERALEVQVDKVAVFTSASEGFARANVNASIAETIDRFRPVIEGAHAAGRPVRGYVSCVVACPYDGGIEPALVRDACERLLEIGIDELDLGDTIGAARPEDIEALLAGLDGLVATDDLVLHLHDTNGMALACARRALELGIRRFDSACGGLGGCPFAPGSPGNVGTEALVRLCEELGFETGIDRAGVEAAAQAIITSLKTSRGDRTSG